MDRYMLLITSYHARDKATLALALIAMASVAVWPLLDKIPATWEIRPQLIQTYSVGVLTVYLMVLSFSFYLGG